METGQICGGGEEEKEERRRKRRKRRRRRRKRGVYRGYTGYRGPKLLRRPIGFCATRKEFQKS